MTLPQTPIEVEFSQYEGGAPLFANAVVSNPSPDGGIVIDFGFIDPLLINSSKIKQAQELAEQQDAIGTSLKDLSLKVSIKSFNHIVIPLNTAEQLVLQIQGILSLLKANQEKQNDAEPSS